MLEVHSAIPIQLVAVTARSTVGRVDVAWLLAMTAVCIAQLVRPRGLRRIAGTVLIASYAAFVAVQLIAG